jgi:hypothetical protein
MRFSCAGAIEATQAATSLDEATADRVAYAEFAAMRRGAA